MADSSALSVQPGDGPGPDAVGNGRVTVTEGAPCPEPPPEPPTDPGTPTQPVTGQPVTVTVTAQTVTAQAVTARPVTASARFTG